MVIHYYNDLCEKECIINVYNDIYIDNEGAHFSTLTGFRMLIKMKNIIKIVPDND